MPTVYKYRDWTAPYHSRILTNNALYFASPAQVNDPFDFRLSAGHGLLQSDEERTIVANGMIRDALDRDKSFDVPRMRAHLVRTMREDPAGFEAEWNEISEKRGERSLGIVSLSRCFDDITLWAHYGNSHKGFCVGFDSDKLKVATWAICSPVTYSSDFPRIHPLRPPIEHLLVGAFTKALAWKYEQEHRLATIFRSDGKDRREVQVPDDCFVEVIIGLLTPKRQKVMITAAARKKGIPVYQMQRAPNAYALERVLIQ